MFANRYRTSARKRCCRNLDVNATPAGRYVSAWRLGQSRWRTFFGLEQFNERDEWQGWCDPPVDSRGGSSTVRMAGDGRARWELSRRRYRRGPSLLEARGRTREHARGATSARLQGTRRGRARASGRLRTTLTRVSRDLIRARCGHMQMKFWQVVPAAQSVDVLQGPPLGLVAQ